MKNTYGTQSVDYLSKIETISDSYAFIKFGMFRFCLIQSRPLYQEKKVGVPGLPVDH